MTTTSSNGAENNLKTGLFYQHTFYCFGASIKFDQNNTSCLSLVDTNPEFYLQGLKVVSRLGIETWCDYK